MDRSKLSESRVVGKILVELSPSRTQMGLQRLKMRNGISIDLEDWFCVYNLRDVVRREDWDIQELRIDQSTRLILKLLSIHNTKATFFVLGWIAEQVPGLVREIEEEGFHPDYGRIS
ncbi:polysaccharide deacetylase family protein, partial [bacterium]|nr:polysaccharide deacetylase family protein [bacterium]